MALPTSHFKASAVPCLTSPARIPVQYTGQQASNKKSAVFQASSHFAFQGLGCWLCGCALSLLSRSPAPLYSTDTRAVSALSEALDTAPLFCTEVVCRTAVRPTVLYGCVVPGFCLEKHSQINLIGHTQLYSTLICHTQQYSSDWLYPEELGSEFCVVLGLCPE